MKNGISLVGLILVIVCIVAVICFVAQPKETVKDDVPQDVVTDEVEDTEDVEDTETNDGDVVINLTSKLEVESASDLEAIITDLYADNENLYPSLANQVIDITDKDSVSYMTGLENGDDLEYLVVSEPMMSSQAYSLVIAKVKDGVNANDIAKEMSENIDTRKWICVSADQLYATSSGDIAFLVMSSEEMATPVYNAFKKKAGTVGEEYRKSTEVENVTAEDMY